jgi:biopolymer transport protein ExbD
MATPGTWLVRLAGDPTPRTLDDPHKVLDGIRDGEWEPSDEVRGPGETLWRPVEEHPTFADAIADMGPPPPEPPDETHLDMNPLIDVALVLLVFFILTATVTSLRRTIDVPPPQPESDQKQVDISQIQDRIFRVQVSMDGEKPVVLIEKRPIVFENLQKEITDTVRGTGRKEMVLHAADEVPWEVFVQVQGAANEAGVRAIHIPTKKK